MNENVRFTWEDARMRRGSVQHRWEVDQMQLGGLRRWLRQHPTRKDDNSLEASDDGCDSTRRTEATSQFGGLWRWLRQHRARIGEHHSLEASDFGYDGTW